MIQSRILLKDKMKLKLTVFTINNSIIKKKHFGYFSKTFSTSEAKFLLALLRLYWQGKKYYSTMSIQLTMQSNQILIYKFKV